MSNPALYEAELALLEAARVYERAISVRAEARAGFLRAMGFTPQLYCDQHVPTREDSAPKEDAEERAMDALTRMQELAITWARLERS